MERSLLANVFVIAIFTSSISPEQLSCKAETEHIDCLPSDRKTLLDIKNSLNDPQNTLSSWRNGTDCCSWRGILCDGITGSISAVDVHNVSGEINPSLMHLKSLKHLDLSSNKFEGIPIPQFFGSLKNLRYLNLSNAGFSGSIPQNLGNLSNLQYLDVSNFGLIVDDFRWMNRLVSLKHIGMNYVDLSSVNSNWLEILNSLPHLKEVHLSSCGLSGSISNLLHVNFTSLAVVDLSFNAFGSNFPDWLINITSLVYVDLSDSMIRGMIPLGFGDLPNLRFLNLGLNGNLSGDSLSLFRRRWRSIEYLSLASNEIHGELPSSVGNMTSLIEFDLFDNNIEGGIPSSIGSLCKLVSFDLSGNNLTGTFPELLEGSEECVAVDSDSPFLPSLVKLRLSNNKLTGKLPGWLTKLKNLEELSLDYNLFEGPLPVSIGSLRNLTHLNLGGNKLTGTLPESTGQLSELVVLDVSSNDLTGVLSEVHFSTLRKMKIMSMASNSFVLDIDDSGWLPSFQIRNLDMGSCKLGPLFPRWLKSQNEIMFLDISNTSITDSVPLWFWDLISSNLSLLNVSYNHLKGQLPSSFKVLPYADLDFSYNMFEGPIPIPSVPIELLDLSNNRFDGSVPRNISDVMPDLIFLSLSSNQLTGLIPDNIGNMSSLSVLDLSRNSLMGSIPSSIGKCSYLKVLDIGNNNLSGEIPNSIGHLNQLRSLHLNDNSISGKLPFSLQNLSMLETMDLGKNKLGGTLEPWLGGGFSSLRILNLRSNSFSGEILENLSNLTSLQVLDLAENNFIGKLPTSLGDLKAMSEEQMTNEYLLYGKYRGVYYEESFVLNLKNQSQKFTKTLSLVTALDLSGNNLSGEFPVEITELKGLMVLNLSRNRISGRIPESISRLRKIGSLDLSSNELSGNIPSSMATMSSLGYLNLSNNDLSGKIPYVGQLSTFVASVFEGNSRLCGPPLVVKCSGKGERDDGGNRNGVMNESNDDGFIDGWFNLSIGMGFACGLLVPFVVLIIRRSWSDKYFDFLDNLIFKMLGVGKRTQTARVNWRRR